METIKEPKGFTLKRKHLFGNMVYIAYRNELVVYVGFSSIGLFRPLSHNFLREITHIHIKKFRSKEDAIKFEKELIIKLQPPYNIVGNFYPRHILFCLSCKKELLTGRADRRYCSDACRQKVYRVKNMIYKLPIELRDKINKIINK